MYNVCSNCSESFSEDSLIFLNISSKVLTLSLGLEPDIFILQANSPTTDLLTFNDKPLVLGDRIPPFFVKKKFPVFSFLFGISVINLCYIIREISLFHIIREISLFLPVYYPAPATININILEGNKLCFILCQDKAFEDKMNCQFQRVS